MIDARNLLHTKIGVKWQEQFDLQDREAAKKIVSSLTLVSSSEFMRSVKRALDSSAETSDGPCAFFAVREVQFGELTAELTNGQVNALSQGADHGSESIIANIIRNFCIENESKYLNHPSIEVMRDRSCRTVFLVDDFVGSGERVTDYLDEFWSQKSIKSWLSYKYIKFVVLIYSGVSDGISLVCDHKIKPEVKIKYSCPTYKNMPWNKALKSKIFEVIKKYGSKTSQGYYYDGYGQGMVSIVFEHNCPDNAPAILWAKSEEDKPWVPLFNNRTVSAGIQSVFPAEINAREAKVVLLDAGQTALANSGSLLRRSELGQQVLIILALIAKGQRKTVAFSYATSLEEIEVLRLINICIKFEFITRTWRITKRGSAELASARVRRLSMNMLQDRGEIGYYPKSLRKSTHG